MAYNTTAATNTTLSVQDLVGQVHGFGYEPDRNVEIFLLHTRLDAEVLHELAQNHLLLHHREPLTDAVARSCW